MTIPGECRGNVTRIVRLGTFVGRARRTPPVTPPEAKAWPTSVLGRRFAVYERAYTAAPLTTSAGGWDNVSSRSCSDKRLGFGVRSTARQAHREPLAAPPPGRRVEAVR